MISIRVIIYGCLKLTVGFSNSSPKVSSLNSSPHTGKERSPILTSWRMIRFRGKVSLSSHFLKRALKGEEVKNLLSGNVLGIEREVR